MATATLHGPQTHKHGAAFTVEAFIEEDDYGPLEVPWRGFKENSIYESWSYEWQTRADRLRLWARRAEAGDFDVDQAMEHPEFRAYVERIADKFREREDLDDEVPDASLPSRILMAMWNGTVNPSEPDDDYGLYTYADAALEALQALPLPRWARIEDGRPKGRLLLVFERGRSMEDFEYWLRHGRSPRSKPKTPRDVLPTRRRTSATRASRPGSDSSHPRRKRPRGR